MRWSFASVGLIIIGLFGIIIIVLFHEITVSNEQDYFTLKEATEASMIEAIDTTYYRLTGKIKISEEKFVENFTKRFAKSATFGQGNYYIDFYQIIESPAKVSLRIVDATNSYNIFTTFDESVGTTQTSIVNELSAILDGYESLETTNSGIYPVSYWDNEDTKPNKKAKKPTLKCPGYNSTATSKVLDLKYDLLNGICIYTKQEESSIPGKYISRQKMTTATIMCPDKYHLVEGWCVPDKT